MLRPTQYWVSQYTVEWIYGMISTIFNTLALAVKGTNDIVSIRFSWLILASYVILSYGNILFILNKKLVRELGHI